MSLVKFELLDDHIKLIKEINWSTISFPHNENCVPNPHSPFGLDSKLINDVGLILFGNKGHTLTPDSEISDIYTDSEIEWMKKIYKELPTALDIVCYFSDFKPGKYKTKYPLREWKRY